MTRARRLAGARQPGALLVIAGVCKIGEPVDETICPQQRRVDGDVGRGLPLLCIGDGEAAGPDLLGGFFAGQIPPQARGSQIGPELIQGPLDLNTEWRPGVGFLPSCFFKTP
jgi:hypothetical protein